MFLLCGLTSHTHKQIQSPELARGKQKILDIS
jgi:hypothetical protein